MLVSHPRRNFGGSSIEFVSADAYDQKLTIQEKAEFGARSGSVWGTNPTLRKRPEVVPRIAFPRLGEEMNGRQGGAFGSFKVGVNTEAACENPAGTNAVLTPLWDRH
jgi:hypothetical protein